MPAFYIYRYAFGFVFMYIIVAHRSFENLKEGIKTWKIGLALAIYELISIFVLIFAIGRAVRFWVIFDMILGAAFCICIWVCRLNLKKCFKKAILGIIVLLILIELCINSAYSMKEMKDKSSGAEMEYYVSLSSFFDYLYTKVKDLDNSVYRLENRYKINKNDGLVFGVNGINYSGSTYSKKLYDFLSEFGYSCQHVVVSSEIGNTRVSDMLLGIKYIMNTDKKIAIKNYKEYKIDDNIIIYKNPYNLSLGYSVNDKILNEIKSDNSNA